MTSTSHSVLRCRSGNTRRVALRRPVDRAHELLVERMPRRGQAADDATPPPLAVVPRRTGRVERPGLGVDVVDRRVHQAELVGDPAHLRLEHAGAVDPQRVVVVGGRRVRRVELLEPALRVERVGLLAPARVEPRGVGRDVREARVDRLGRRRAARGRVALIERVADAEPDRVAREVVVVVALLRGPAHGPARVLGDRVGRTDRDVGVDQRAAADAGRAEDRDAVVVPQSEQPLAAERGQVVEPVLVALAPHAAGVDVEEAAEVVRRGPGLHRLALALEEREGLDVLVLDRRGLRRPPRAALEHEDPLAVAARLERARKAQRGHRATEPRADHDGVVVLFRCLHHKPPGWPPGGPLDHPPPRPGWCAAARAGCVRSVAREHAPGPRVVVRERRPRAAGVVPGIVSCRSSAAAVQHVAEPVGERLGLAGVAELAAEEAAVVAREHGRLLPEQRGGRH